MFKNPSLFFKGFAKGKGKQPIQNVDSKHLLTFDEVKDCDSYGAILQDGLVDESYDTDELSQKFFDMSDENDWNCLMLENPSNPIHYYKVMVVQDVQSQEQVSWNNQSFFPSNLY